MERQWYYVVGGKEKAGPVSESELKQRIQTGQVQPADLVWAEGMSNWQAASQIPSLTGGGPSMAAPAAAQSPMQRPYGAAANVGGDVVPEGLLGWSKFVGIMTILMGVLNCLTCIGIPVGIMMIVAGNALMGSRRTLEQYGGTAQAMEPYLQHIKKFLLMHGIIYILGLVGFVIYLIVMFFVIGGGLMSMGDFMGN